MGSTTTTMPRRFEGAGARLLDRCLVDRPCRAPLHASMEFDHWMAFRYRAPRGGFLPGGSRTHSRTTKESIGYRFECTLMTIAPHVRVAALAAVSMMDNGRGKAGRFVRIMPLQ